MNQDQYCGLKEHQKETSVCVMRNCGYQSRLICKVCNSKQFHSHNQETNSHLLDLEIIQKNQQALKDQSYQYHKKINKIHELQQQIYTCKSYLDDLDNILNKQIRQYDKYIENLYSIQIHLSSKEFEIEVDYELAYIINEVNNFKQCNKNQLLNILNKIIINISKINESIKQGNETQNNKSLQVVNHGQLIEFAQICPNNQDLLIGCQQKIYSYNLQQQTYKQICKFSNTQSFVISKDNQLFYFNDEGAVNIYNRNLNKCKQIILQKYELQFIMVLSKVLAVAYFQMQSQLYIINLKLKKTIFKFEFYVNIVDIHYIENQNLLIVAQPFIVDIMMLNSKFKSQTLEYNNSRIVNIQFDQQNQQLIILDIKGVLTFWTLNKNGKFIKNSNQISIKYSQFRYFRYNQNLQQYIVFAASEIIFYDIQGEILYNLNHSYEDIMFQNTLSNYYSEPILFRTDNSITLLRCKK